MVNLKQKLSVALLVLGVSVSALAQKGNDNSNKRPDKNPPVVVVQPKEKPPQNNQDKNKGGDKDKKGKP